MGKIISDTVKRLFPDDFEELVPVKKHWWQKIDFENLKRKEALWITLGLLLVSLPGIYYWNHFVILLTNAQTARAQIEVQLQRRKDLLINLTTTLLDYSEHERSMYQYTVDRRQGVSKKSIMLLEELKKAGLTDLAKSGTGNIDGATAKLLAIAEAYPELKLSANFLKMMDALVATEDKIADCRMFYNDKANAFGTYAMSFPNCIYAFVFGFSPSKFPFVKVDKDVMQYNRIKY